MRIEIVEDTAEALNFPPNDDYVDLRKNPHALERIAAAREYLPLRNFLTAVNSSGSVYSSVAVATECHSPGDASSGNVYEFGSRVSLVFAVPSLNCDRNQYAELTAKLKELLERDPGGEVSGELGIYSCNFLEQRCQGFCLEIRLMASGESAKQAETRWGLGLARVQQALLFRARALGQQIGA
jgi:hypothetical protein